MKPTERIKPLQQIYSNYTPEDFLVWGTLYNRQMDSLTENGCKDYLKAVRDIQFNANEIPHFENTNAILKSFTGWNGMVFFMAAALARPLGTNNRV